ncbi:phage tail protein [Mesorhizobium japonicum]|uniref:Mlr6550 protein n=1 Tax=Mesorhizobium japonicum (strain LMG 29417 / CECT 9101 / MAFF 303099) TaxID=266835 RepID=Q988X7_RHILO|nr:phage tail protein [Mesorhizobium japonicum]BAB52820.1 mlr6550 [Mesorhizobium japonicum MAFF 303099]
MAPRIDPIRNFRFLLEIDNVTRAGFSEVAIAETTIEAVDYREGTDPPHMRKLSGLTKYGSITLKAGMTTDANSLELFKWHNDVSVGLISERRRNIAISVRDESGKTEQARFVISEAWPIKYDPSDLSGKGNEVMIELLELANEGIERVK